MPATKVKYNLNKLKHIAGLIMTDLIYKFKTDIITFEMEVENKEYPVIRFTTKLVDNEYISGGIYNFTDKYKENIIDVFKQRGLTANFNNTNSIFFTIL